MSGIGAGTTLCDGRYRLDEVVGRGGMAVVWRARDLQLERDVAIKIISDVLAGDPSFVARFEREARLAGALNHENLVKVFDFSVDDERPILVMEYISGGTLADARRRPLDVDTLARELLDAVAHIHGAGILHRDIKPANVLLDASGSPRLTDFGIARGEESTGITLTGQILGTLRYIAPEVAAGEPATVQSDLYSLGVLLGELEGAPSEPLERLIAQMTAHDPSKRPNSAAEALAELDPTQILAPTARGQTPFTDVSFTSERGLTPPLRLRFSRSWAFVCAAVFLVVLAVIVAAASGGGSRLDVRAPGRALRPAPAGAPVDRQLDQLERLVRAAPRRN